MPKKAKRDKYNSVPLQQYFDELRAADQRALTIKQTADESSLVLAREIQTYKDEQHNGLLRQLGEERGHYVSQDQHQALQARLEALIKPLTEYMVAQIAASAEVKDYRGDQRDDEDLAAAKRQASAVSIFRSNATVVISCIAALVAFSSVILTATHVI